MGMPITIEIVGGDDNSKDSNKQKATIEKAFDYFVHIDEKFSTYKDTSEITAINKGRIAPSDQSEEMRLVLMLAEETKQASNGYFDIQKPDGSFDPSGLVKGWAIWNATQLIQKEGFLNFYVDAGGDIQPHGTNSDSAPWAIGIKNPWNQNENIKIVYAANNEGVATSGTYIRGEHIYDPHTGSAANAIVSLTVIGPNIYEADRFATAAFAMGKNGIRFIESLPGFEGYMIDNEKTATMTTGFEKFTNENDITNRG